MKGKALLILGALAMVTVVTLPSSAQAQSRILQQILINGQPANGAYVSAVGGAMQSFTCDGPQPYSTPDGATRGWACYDGSTGVWLLNALPPAGAQASVVYQPQSAVVYQPSPVVVYPSSPVVVYSRRVRPVVVAPVYSSSVVWGTAAINVGSRIVASAISRPPVIVRAPVVIRPPVTEWHPHGRSYAEPHHRGNLRG